MRDAQKNAVAASRVRIEAEAAGQRIDNYLLRHLKGVPRSYVYRILRKGEVRVNKGRIRAHYRLQEGDEVRLPPVRTSAVSSTAVPGPSLLARLHKCILYEDKGLIAIDKPSGLAVHGGSGISFGVIEAVRAMRPDDRHLELVHRLDRDTSGCLLISKKRSVLRRLHLLLRSNQVEKRYLALLAGQLKRPHLLVNAPLSKNTLSGGERMVAVNAQGKPARTRFQSIESFEEATLVAALPQTGRTHQIRVHAAHCGHPVAGDSKYGTREGNRRFREFGLHRLFLHAASLSFRLDPDQPPVTIAASLDPELHQVLQAMRR